MMMRLFVLVGLLFASVAAHAVEDVPTASYNETAPTSANIPNWTTGWTQPTGSTSTITGWNYVGSVNGNSAVYLGNGWVLTAAHNNAGDLSLGGVTYPLVPNSTKTFGTTDLILFQISPTPALPVLPIRTTDPKAGTSQVAMLGWGHVSGNRVPTWGCDTVTAIASSLKPIVVTVNGVTYTTSDFLTEDTSTNVYQVVDGDSGGGDFIFNSTNQRWELAGINEAVVSDNNAAPFYSAMVQVDLYQAQIAAAMAPVTDTPTLPPWAVGLLAGTLAWMAAPICSGRRLS